MSQTDIRGDEDLTELGVHGWQVLQKKQGLRFSLEAVLLAHFADPPRGARVLELGCGCGVISLLLEARTPLRIDAVELQPQLADMARRSVAGCGLSARVRVFQADLTHLGPRFQEQYDWVVCNPPFFPRGCGKESPVREVALARHEIACTLDAVLAAAAQCLKPGGRLALVQRAARLPETLSGCGSRGLRPLRLRLVHPGAEDAAGVFLLEARRGGRGDLRVLPPLLIYDAPADAACAAEQNAPRRYSPEVAAYFAPRRGADAAEDAAAAPRG